MKGTVTIVAVLGLALVFLLGFQLFFANFVGSRRPNV